MTMQKKKKISLTKTLFVTGFKCRKALWMSVNKPFIKAPLNESQKQNIEEGHFVGKIALEHSLYKGGILIETLDKDLAKIQTRKVIKKSKIIYEGAFATKFKNIELFIRSDILSLNDDGTYDLIEVKSASNATKYHFADIAFQKYVLEKCGLIIRDCYLMSVNNKYVRGERLIIEELFKIGDVNEEITKFNIPVLLNEMVTCLNTKIEPEQMTGGFCKDPYPCPFLGHCKKDINKDSVDNLARLSEKKRNEFAELNIKYIKDIPEDFELTSRQAIQRICAIKNMLYVDNVKIKEALKQLKYPYNHLDFEAYVKAIPRFENLRPNQFVTFQASLHIEKKDGTISHHNFLQTDHKDPRIGMIKFLIEHMGKNKGSIVVFNKTFEKTRIEELARNFPEYKEELDKIIARLWDLAWIFENFFIYHSDQKGSASIKKVLPVMCPELSYDMLKINNGSDAQAQYWKLISNSFRGAKKKAVIQALLTYCGLDTWAMIKILYEVKKLVKMKTNPLKGEVFDI